MNELHMHFQVKEKDAGKILVILSNLGVTGISFEVLKDNTVKLKLNGKEGKPEKGTIRDNLREALHNAGPEGLASSQLHEIILSLNGKKTALPNHMHAMGAKRIGPRGKLSRWVLKEKK